ncbi:hypothetical protein [Streptomyces albireticuli]|uniref:Uncharacterized protein n=1 Tax=Streptomyces albireticuli TaxID=1940 RepID=A0A2A2DI19_9ACTN|nr:hypothetical protein [Streptomyces albireticuli]MCD9146108.1 hypothetical protein [Streptomyces albireticuli]MCD9166199.1 hypothetical protein [Streptomyces albireticuli]MCD9196508.1 hypothetical protein [Streptomyces albireticuli]PAU50902.1 hypothetical protein CK936_00125 [Streptomyces albireticuli]
MPRRIDETLADVGLPDLFSEEDMDDLKKEIVREVTDSMMFGAMPAPTGHFPTTHDQANKDLQALTAQLLHHDDVGHRLSELCDEGIDPDGALHFACLLSLANEPACAQFWWQFSAGAGNALAAYCLHLLHLGRGDLRDADHWACQAVALTDHYPGPLFELTTGPQPHFPIAALRKVVGRLKADVVEEFGFGRVLHPDLRLADQIEELADAF